MKRSISLILVLLLLGSCNGKNESLSTKNVKATTQGAKAKVTATKAKEPSTKGTAKANATVQFQVSGMVCKMGCGGAIKKELAATGAVEYVDVSFEEDLPAQAIVVYYDAKKTDPFKLTERIEAINDGDFSVVGVRKEPFDAKALQALMK
ncbi:MAG: heavy-metal-associated domain-containing protein [Flavobacteriales bacterium]